MIEDQASEYVHFISTIFLPECWVKPEALVLLSEPDEYK